MTPEGSLKPYVHKEVPVCEVDFEVKHKAALDFLLPHLKKALATDWDAMGSQFAPRRVVDELLRYSARPGCPHAALLGGDKAFTKALKKAASLEVTGGPVEAEKRSFRWWKSWQKDGLLKKKRKRDRDTDADAAGDATESAEGPTEPDAAKAKRPRKAPKGKAPAEVNGTGQTQAAPKKPEEDAEAPQLIPAVPLPGCLGKKAKMKKHRLADGPPARSRPASGVPLKKRRRPAVAE
eukprot:NODE_11_length_3034_cov_73.123953_g8_i0.p3 GENE.NODE_11_length_3034_cov_73.123953_g8_i0~~NODE_11_length_3034_cov_73.123953_g8_i0.p3  ORF type:complete len:236 (-),score=88.20 NODE_11_length_3034_cov_73.123953_g8_i0:78-785(-)